LQSFVKNNEFKINNDSAKSMILNLYPIEFKFYALSVEGL